MAADPGTFDHVIIGSGINGLVAASLLALKGAGVLVLERETRIGGCLLTEEVTLPGGRHDVMAATFVLFKTSSAGAALGPHLAQHGVAYCHSPHPTAVLRPDGTALVLMMDQANNVCAFNRLMAGDGDQYARDVGGIAAGTPFLFALLGGNLWWWAMAKLLFRQVRKRGLRGLAACMGRALRPARGWLESNDQSPLAQGLWAPWVLHCGLTPDSAYSAQMGKVIAFSQNCHSAHEAFADRIEAILSSHIKDFDQIKLARKAYSPVDLERMNCNLVGGDSYGGACSMDQFFICRPFAHSTNGVGQVRGSIHTGASTHPGPGLGGGSGFNAAKRGWAYE